MKNILFFSFLFSSFFSFSQKTIDSINKPYKIEKKNKILHGYYPMHKYFDIDFLNLINYNHYEKFRFQLGGVTNEKLSKKWRLASHIAYGIGDSEFKYAGSIRYKLWHNTQTYIKLSYNKDLEKSGNFNNFNERSLSKTNHYISNNKFYMKNGYRIDIEHLITSNFEVNINFTQENIITKFNIPYHNSKLEFPSKNITYIQTRLALAPFSKYLLTNYGKKILKDGYPKMYFSFEKNIPTLTVNQIDYYRIDIQTLIKKSYNNHNYSEILLKFGLASNGIGIDKLYQPNTNNFLNNNFLKSFYLNKKFSFETMNDYEFIDNFLITSHLRHTFQKINTYQNKSIDISLIGRMAFGLSYESNKYTNIKSLDKIYYETGFEFHRLIKNFGLGFYYRLGKYAYPNVWKNIAVHLIIDPFKLITF